jgi:DNA polymerase I-like protein with 3'-5' exonuclease and polymerase domains
VNILTIDFETFYDKQFSLTKLTTEEYIRDERFQTIGVSVKRNDEPAVWFSGSDDDIRKFLSAYNWEESLGLAHNAMFDAAILSWKYSICPRGWLDTLSMARSHHGSEVGGSLKKLTEHYELGQKGTEVIDALGKRREDFTKQELQAYGAYCINDVELTYKLFHALGEHFSKSEFKLIDATIRMFSEPVLELDLPLLEQHLEEVKDKKASLLAACVADKDTLMSNEKFAKLLWSLGVEPPMKVSPATGKETYAFAKTDEGFKALQEHEDERVQALVAARLGTKSTLEETRTQRFIDIGKRGSLPVPLRYYAAHTGRWGGDDKLNLQNLPRKSMLKQAIMAPEGYVFIDSDSSQIEARTLAWLAGQNDLVEAFEKGEDVYRIMAAKIYHKPENEITPEERFVGKTTILGCIGAGTLVLCDSGWKPIEQVSLSDKLWDGEEWVCHKGLLNKGIKQTLSLCGAWLTPDHKVWSGTQWLEAQSVVADENILSQALGTGAANLPSQAMYAARDWGSKPLSCSATAMNLSTPWTSRISRILKALGVPHVPKRPLAPNDTGFTLKPWLTTPTARGYLTGCLLPLPVAITPMPRSTKIMGAVAFLSTKNGVTIGQHFFNMFKHLRGGTTPSTKLTGLTMTGGMSRATYGLQLEAKTCGTSDEWKNFSKKLMTYDLAYVGPRNRFTILTERGPVVVHNCGYGMGAEKFHKQLKTFGKDIPIDTCRRILDTYRSAYPMIPKLWKDGQRCLEALVQGRSTTFGKHPQAVNFLPFIGFELPSGMFLKYQDIKETADLQNPLSNQFEYKTRQGWIKIYGGKVVENVCQAVARCVIGEQLLRISKRYRVVLTVHDAIACIAREEEAEEAVAYVSECMRWRPDWCSTLPLNCETGYGKRYGES